MKIQVTICDNFERILKDFISPVLNAEAGSLTRYCDDFDMSCITLAGMSAAADTLRKNWREWFGNRGKYSFSMTNCTNSEGGHEACDEGISARIDGDAWFLMGVDRLNEVNSAAESAMRSAAHQAAIECIYATMHKGAS